MARTIEEIKLEMTNEFIGNTTIQTKYGLDTTKSFDEQFSKVSIENILFYVFAFCVWVLEKLFDTHRKEVTDYIDSMKPHSLRWYVSKTKLFRYGQPLIEGTDEYSDEGLSDSDIEQRQIVKYASGEEVDGKLYIKVAKENNGTRGKLDSEEETALAAYIGQVKDAGVKIEIRNENAVPFKLDMVVYYDPTILDGDGKTIDGGSDVVRNAIREFVENLPFNGLYRDIDLVDKLQTVDGVKIPVLGATYYKLLNANDWTRILVCDRPYSGYYSFDTENSSITFQSYADI